MSNRDQKAEKQMPGFMIYKETALMLSVIDKENAAAAIQAACQYYLTGEMPSLTGTAAQIFEYQKSSIDRGRETYKKKLEGAYNGAGARWGKQPSDGTDE